jgi:hypothetical protein
MPTITDAIGDEGGEATRRPSCRARASEYLSPHPKATADCPDSTIRKSKFASIVNFNRQLQRHPLMVSMASASSRERDTSSDARRSIGCDDRPRGLRVCDNCRRQVILLYVTSIYRNRIWLADVSSLVIERSRNV